MAKQEDTPPGYTEEEDLRKTYKNPVLYLRKSKAGEHLYAFNVEKEDGMVLGGGVGSLIVNVSDVVRLIDDKIDWIKVSVLPAEEGE